MAENLGSRFKKAWNVFFNKDPTMEYDVWSSGYGSSIRPDRLRLSIGNERTIIGAIYTIIANDATSMSIKHVRLDDNQKYVEDIKSSLNYCLTTEANVDQTGCAFMRDVVFSMLDEGCVAIVPTDVNSDSKYSESTNSDDILSLRVGKILEWYPNKVRVSVYNEHIGEKSEIVVKKTRVAIVENPFYSIMNEPNSTYKRLLHKLNLLDVIDNQNGSPKMDLIIQLPYAMKVDAKQKLAEKRRKELEDQLANSKYGIGYIDATEHITQLNRAVESNLMPQIEYLTNMLYSQLGITPEILNGTANEQVMKNYMTRTILPIMRAIAEEMDRKFLSKTARTQKQAIRVINNPFETIATSQIAEMSDKLTRNEIMTSNEVRQILGLRPSNDPKADELRNKNLKQSTDKETQTQPSDNMEDDSDDVPLLTDEEYQQTISDLDAIDEQLYQMENDLKDDAELKHYASPYYDPVKVHEYYEKNKKLKGRTSTTGLNDEGKQAAKYVKEQLTTERKSKTDSKSEAVKAQIESSKRQRDSKISAEKESVQKQIEAHKQHMQSEIDGINAKIKSGNLSSEQKDALRADIKTLRNENSEERAKVQLMYKTTAAELRNDHKEEASKLRAELKQFRSDTKTEYDEKYVEELDKIKADPSLQKTLSKKSSDSAGAQSSPKLYAGEEYERRLAEVKAKRKQNKK